MRLVSRFKHGRKSWLFGAVVATMLSGVAVFGAASPAAAAFDRVRCNINPITGIEEDAYCTPIEAHSSQHWVKIDVQQLARYTEWWLTDLNTGAVVGHGVGDARNRTIYGLYGKRYQLHVHGYGTNAMATNYT